jgi:hypothetical protein
LTFIHEGDIVTALVHNKNYVAELWRVAYSISASYDHISPNALIT